MKILRGLNLFIETYIRIFRGLKSMRLLAPFLILAILKGFLLVALVSFYLPPIRASGTALGKAGSQYLEQISRAIDDYHWNN